MLVRECLPRNVAVLGPVCLSVHLVKVSDCLGVVLWEEFLIVLVWVHSCSLSGEGGRDTKRNLILSHQRARLGR